MHLLYLDDAGSVTDSSQRHFILAGIALKVAKAQQEMRLQTLASEFKDIGHTWGLTRNLADVPLFVDSSATRIIQYADLVAYAMWRKFEKGDNEFFEVIAGAFDREGGVVHGLHHFKNPTDPCDCPGCIPSFY